MFFVPSWLTNNHRAPLHFASAADFRRWLEKHHATVPELIVVFYKKSVVGKRRPDLPSEAVDELLSFGWIDGVVRRVDDERYMHRVTPRRPGSIWSNVNLGHVARLTKATAGCTPPGSRPLQPG